MIYQWHIYIASLDPVRGSEQAGWRPVLIVSRERLNQVLPVVNVVPITSRKSPRRRTYANEVLLPAGTASLANDSIAICYQIRTLDKSRLNKEIGEVTEPKIKNQIKKALRFQLEI